MTTGIVEKLRGRAGHRKLTADSDYPTFVESVADGKKLSDAKLERLEQVMAELGLSHDELQADAQALNRHREMKGRIGDNYDKDMKKLVEHSTACKEKVEHMTYKGMQQLRQDQVDAESKVGSLRGLKQSADKIHKDNPRIFTKG